MHIDGGCHCGAIRFSADIKPDGVLICHCTDCQILTGAAYRIIVGAPAATFKLTGKLSIYTKTTADSGARRRQAFCPACGTPIYSSEDSDTPAVYGLRVGAIRQRAELAPKRQIWRRSALAWAMDLHGLPSVDGQN
ncbi:MAG: GFA family protein [Proteobacteria bacterium]|nr:GFA family protein [Pseudomonadota bacterium]